MSPLVDKESLQREFPITPEIEKMWEDYDKNKQQLQVKMQYTNTDEDEWVDYPYIGIGIKPHTLNKKKRIPNEEDVERIIGG